MRCRSMWRRHRIGQARASSPSPVRGAAGLHAELVSAIVPPRFGPVHLRRARMRLTLVTPHEIAVASPCPVSWDAMDGNHRVRFCHECRKNVYDLSEMTAAEAARLIEKKEGRLCVQLYRRHDGTLITADCSARWRVRLYKCARKHMAWAASFLALVFSLGCVAGGLRQPTVRQPDEPGVSKDPKGSDGTQQPTKPAGDSSIPPGQSGASGTNS